jgi:phosphate:Na+ symporter
LQPLIGFVLASGLAPSEQVALVHTLFNLAAALAALPLVPWLWPRLERWLNHTIKQDEAH